MDAFKRLRSRRKSKGQVDSFVSFAEAESGFKSPTNTWQSSTGRPSATIPRPSVDKKLSHEHFRSISSSTDPRGQTPNSRTQPLLVGISRSFLNTSTSRPGTANSFQDALNRAADAITNPDSVRAAPSPSRQAAYKAGKYIDIFAIAGQASKVDTSYNEDVAARNLDTLAIAVNGSSYRYEPTSKYQEEVANRNAVLHAPARAPSARNPPDGEEEEKRNSIDRINPTTSHTLSSSKEQMSRRGHNQDSTAYQRQPNHRVRDATVLLPAIPQEASDENVNRIIDTPRKDRKSDSLAEKQPSRSRWSEQQIPDARLSHPDYDTIYSTSARKQGHLRVSDVPSQASSANRRSDLSHVSERSIPSSHRSTRQSMEPKVDRNSIHQISANEARTRSRPAAGAVQKTYVTSDGLKSDPIRSPSTISTTSSVKRSLNLGNRRVMDLTGDDSEVFSVTSYITTPQLHNATADTYLKVQPAMIENYLSSRILLSNDPAIPNARWSSALEPVLDLDQLARRSQMIAETAKAHMLQAPHPNDRAATPPPPRTLAFSPIQILTSTAPPKTFAFSPISTLSTSPRSSRGSLHPHENISITPIPVPSGQSTRQLVSQDQVLPEPQVGIQRSNSNRISAKIAPLVKVFADISPEDAGKSQSTLDKTHPTSGRSAPQRTSREVNEGLWQERENHEKVASSKADTQIPVNILVPSSSISQNNLAGITTRDFAMPPIEKPTVKRIEALSERKRTGRTASKEDVTPTSALKLSSSSGERKNRSNKSANKVAFDEQPSFSVTSSKRSGKRPEKSSGKKNNGKKTASSSKKPRPVSIFDEEAFQRKQNEANAALLRLQESLQENLDDDESGQGTPLATPGSRALSPAVNQGSVRTSDPQRPSIYYPSPSQAAMAMIAAATASPRNRVRADVNAKLQPDHSQGSRDITGAAAAVSRSTTEDGPPPRSVNPSRNGITALNPMLAHIGSSNSKPPPSPGEVSLSAFPLPSSRAISPEMKQNPPIYVRDVAPAPVRRGSQGSRMSSGSVFSIPSGMVPGRGSSLPLNRMGVPGPSTSTTMDSIASVIPPSKNTEINVG